MGQRKSQLIQTNESSHQLAIYDEQLWQQENILKDSLPEVASGMGHMNLCVV
ncbi:hypothetical protein [Rufibacter aurantiacus]|uniref:hypothetical protein n=1 Tax=Rufibacter aurantiacus TaxID=2817374 RepID=UPI001B3148DE|nr:hypothetical protein [Rufibacter aurantiacus]